MNTWVAVGIAAAGLASGRQGRGPSADGKRPSKSVWVSRFLAVSAASLLAACGGGGASSSDSFGGASSSSAGSNCNYADKITASEREQANKCGIQVSANYAQADSGLASVIAACQRGEKAIADKYYAGTYQQMVDYARQVSRELSCGTNTAPTLPNTSTQSYYNFCAQNTSITGTPRWSSGSCWGPVQQGEGGCPSTGTYAYISQYSSMDSCKTAGQNWLNSR